MASGKVSGVVLPLPMSSRYSVPAFLSAGRTVWPASPRQVQECGQASSRRQRYRFRDTRRAAGEAVFEVCGDRQRGSGDNRRRVLKRLLACDRAIQPAQGRREAAACRRQCGETKPFQKPR